MSFVNLHKREGILDKDNRDFVSVAEAGSVDWASVASKRGHSDTLDTHRTLQLELKYLSEVTGNPIYWQKAEKVSLSTELTVLSAANSFPRSSTSSASNPTKMDLYPYSCRAPPLLANAFRDP